MLLGRYIIVGLFMFYIKHPYCSFTIELEETTHLFLLIDYADAFNHAVSL